MLGPTAALKKALRSPPGRSYEEGSVLPAWRSGRLTAFGAGAQIGCARPDTTGEKGRRFGGRPAELKREATRTTLRLQQERQQARAEQFGRADQFGPKLVAGNAWATIRGSLQTR